MPMTPFRRAYRTAKKTVKKRYYNKKTGSIRLNRIYKDVYDLKQAINSEKKHSLVEPSTATFAQFTGTGTGHALIELSPAINQGTASNQRVGNQVKITGACMEIQLEKQINQHGTIGFKLMLIQQANGNDSMPIADLLEGNHFLSGTIYDMFSQRNQMQMSNFRVVKTITGRFQQDQNDDVGNDTLIRKNFTIPLKFTKNNLVKYNSGGSITPIRNRFYLVCLAGDGDVNVGTGITIRQYTRWYYVDN